MPVHHAGGETSFGSVAHVHCKDAEKPFVARPVRIRAGDRRRQGRSPALVLPAAGRTGTLAAGLVLAVMVVLGYRAGKGPLQWEEVSHLADLCCLIGMILGLGNCLFPGPGMSRRAAGLVALGLIVYPIISCCGGLPFPVRDGWGKLLIVVWLTPLIAGGLVFARRRAWLAAAGRPLLLFAAVAALAYNKSHLDGVGFFVRWQV